MIKVARSPRPLILEKNADRWLRELRSAKTEASRKRARNRYRHKQVKKALDVLFHGKCAYCESKITHIDYGQIEHYRPKSGPSGREDLTFDWSNLLLACGICNGPRQKGDRFPDALEGGPIVNPCDDDPAENFEFRFDSVARIASVIATSRRGGVTEALLGLNRHELRAYRSRYVEKLVVLRDLARSDPTAAALMGEVTRSDAEYAAFARAVSAEATSDGEPG